MNIVPMTKRNVVFTSFVMIDGKVPFLQDHIDRLFKSAHFLFPLEGWGSKREYIEQVVGNYIDDTLKSKGAEESFYFRVSIFDDQIALERKPLDRAINTVTLCSAVKKRSKGLLPSYLKAANYLETDLELRRAHESGFDDVVFFDIDGFVTEASTSNIFIVTNDSYLVTPPLSSMVLDGVLRKNLLKKMNSACYGSIERIITKTDLEDALEVWVANSVKGLRLVTRFEDTEYSPIHPFFDKAIHIFGRFGERA